ncbi:Verprolin [Smittium mucronatum]|uniref:Verprolin n=1 Tax=Smittium mucronatum TaxID=133383 RepID=A0A1R0H5I6_9FUNG|nr:Verprolin [Smittium mucronatum]
MADRNALLSQIQKGKKLKSAVTNDRSKPVIGNVSSSSAPAPPRSQQNLNNDVGSQNVNLPAAPVGLGNLFAGGMPKLKSRQGGVNTGRGSGSIDMTGDIQTNNQFNQPNNNQNSYSRKESAFAPKIPAPPVLSPVPPKIPYNTGSNENSANSAPKFGNTNFRKDSAPQFSPSPSVNSLNVIKKRPPPPPPSKPKPLVNVSSKPSISSPPTPNSFSTFPKNLNNQNSRASSNSMFESNNHVRSLSNQLSSSLSLNRPNAPPPPSTLPNLPKPPSNSENSLFESKWKFHNSNDFPTFSKNDRNRIGGHSYPSGKKSGSNIPLRF